MSQENRLQFRVSDEDLEAIKANADRLEMSISDFMRYAGVNTDTSAAYDSEIYEHLKAIHEDADKIYQYVQDFYARHSGDITEAVCSRFLELQLLALNKKLRYITEVLKEIKDDAPEYEGDLTYSEYTGLTRLSEA